MAKLISDAKLLQTTIQFKELTLKQYRQLLKCFLGDEIFPELVFTNINNILLELTELTQKQIDNLSFIDYCLLLLHIRQVSIGDTVFLHVDGPEQKQLKIDLRISKVIEEITNNTILNLLQPEIVDSCNLEYRLPTIKEILILEKEKELYSVYTFFLKTINFSNLDINLENYSYKEREDIVQKIPIKVMSALTKRTHTIVECCNEINILKSLTSDIFDKKLILTLNSQIIAFILKLIYNTSLESIYELLFALSKMANFSCNFLDECSPGEFYFFTKKLEEISAKQQEMSQSASSNNELPPVVSEFELE